MATITLSLTGPVDGSQQTISKSATIDDSVLPYFFSCYRARFNGTLTPVVTDEDAFDALAMSFANQGVVDTQAYLRANLPIPNIQVTQNG